MSPVPSPPPDDITARSLAPYLARAVPDLGPLRRLEKFATGQSNPTYRMTCGERDYVLRAKPPGRLLRSAHMVEREYRVMDALADTKVPVPRMVHLASDEASPFGRAFFIMTYMPGRIFWDPALPQMAHMDRRAHYEAMCDVLADLHNVNVDTVGLGDYGKPGDYFARQTARWSDQYKASAMERRPDMDRLMAWLADNLPGDDGQVSLVHGDYRLDNMIFTPERAQVAALLDWELSTIGHPMADVAYQCMQWRLPHEGGLRGLGGLDRAALGIPSELDYLARYCTRRRITTPDNWMFYLAFSYFKLAAILEGVVRRAYGGNASNPETARTYAAAIPILAGQAVEMISRGRTAP